MIPTIDPHEWDEKYLLSLPMGEFDWLEVKGRQAIDLTLSNVEEHKCRENLARSLSAFANSGGGLLIYGLADPKKSSKSWAVDDGGVALEVKNQKRTQEWLNDVIPQLVDEPLVDYRVYEIQRKSDDSQIAEGRGVFVIQIGDSDYAPHQANHIYYARVGGRSRPIGHRLVTDIFNRRRHPKMKLEVKFHIISRRERSLNEIVGNYSVLPPVGNEQEKVKIEKVMKAHFSVKNVGRVLVNFMHCSVWIPKGMVYPFILENDQKIEEIEGTEYVVWNEDNIERDVIKDGDIGPWGKGPEYGPSWYKRILPSRSYHWDWSLLSPDMLEAYVDDYIRWEIVVDSAPIERGKIRIGDIQRTFEDKTRRINPR